MLDKLWMGNHVDDLFLSEERWCQLLRESGFIVEIEPVSYLFSPASQEHAPEAHYIVLAKKVEPEPLLGPYPLPRCLKPLEFQDREDFFADRLVSKDLEKLVEDIGDSPDILCIGKDLLSMASAFTAAIDLGADEWQMGISNAAKVDLSTIRLRIYHLPQEPFRRCLHYGRWTMC